MFSKKKLLSLVERKLNEMPIDYGNNPERMNPDLERKLASKETPYKDNPAIPQDQPEGTTSNFEELISSKRFVDVVNKVKYYSGLQGNVTSQESFNDLRNSMMSSMNDVLQFESQHKEFLENLAVELVKKEMSIPENVVQFDAKLVPIGSIGDEGFQKQSENPSDEEIEQQFGIDSEEASEDLEQFVNAFEAFDDEVAKRRLLNAMVQGSSKKGHYMFELVNNRLNELDPTIIRKYGILMSVNDILYWLFPDEMMMSGGGGGFAGKEEVSKETNPPTVKARGVFFPVLVHELIKGVMDILATKGLPDDPRSAEMVMGVADTLPSEIWDLRFGPIIWEKFIQSYPDRLFNEDKIHLQNYLFSRFSALSTDEFFKLMKMILKGDQMGKTIIERMVSDIEEHLRKEDYEEEEYNQEYGDDGLDGFLGSLGISLSDDEE
jgi:hypothetical protein